MSATIAAVPQVRELACISCEQIVNIDTQKARMLLMLARGKKGDSRAVQGCFDRY